MTGRDLAWRFAGMAILISAAGAGLAHRHLLAVTPNGSVSPIEIGLGLASFLLASFGVLLVINGPQVRDQWAGMRPDRPRLDPEGERIDHATNPRRPIPIDPSGFGSGRIATAYWLAQRARDPSRATPDDHDTGATIRR